MSLLESQKRLVPKSEKEKALNRRMSAYGILFLILFLGIMVASYLHEAGIIRISIPTEYTTLFFSGYFILFIFAFIAFARAYHKRMVAFWSTVATSYGLTYAPSISVQGEPAVMFKQGHSRKGTHVLTGTLHGLPFTTFQYQFSKQEGKHMATYPYTVYEFLFEGRFPHLYLNYEHNYNPGFFERMQMPHVVLPAEFDKHFTLHVPKQYEIEALTIFTPDTLAFLLDNKWKYDVEMLDNRMLVFGRSNFGSAELFMRELEQVSMLVQHLERKLHSASFAPIGNLPYRL